MSKPIFFTPAAETELLRLKKVLRLPDTFGVKIEPLKGETEEHPFKIGFDEPGKTDLVYQMEFFKLVVPKAASMQIIGFTVDFIQEKNGFIFIDRSVS